VIHILARPLVWAHAAQARKETSMNETETEDVLAETEIVHWSPKRGPLIGSGPATSLEAPRPEAKPLLAIGALALGAVAVGALAIGALAIGRLVSGSARIRDLKIDRLVVDDLVVRRRRGSF
jgi:hypothetical protein